MIAYVIGVLPLIREFHYAPPMSHIHVILMMRGRGWGVGDILAHLKDL